MRFKVRLARFLLLCAVALLLPALVAAQSQCVTVDTTKKSQTVACQNPTYAGYGVSGSPFPTPSEPKKVLYSTVTGSWQQPQAIECASGEHSKAAFWVGLGGTDGELEQIGTLIQCDDGVVQYDAVYEIIHDGSGTVVFLKDISPLFTINPYDYITAEVQYLGNGRYILSITNSGHWVFDSLVLSGGKDVSAHDAALWIAEAPTLNGQIVPLTYFNMVSFSGCKADGKPISNGRTINQFNIVNDDSEAEASPLDSGSTAFTVKMPPQS